MISYKIPIENHCFTEISWFLTQVIRVGRSPHSDVLFGSGFPGTAWILVMKWSCNEVGMVGENFISQGFVGFVVKTIVMRIQKCL